MEWLLLIVGGIFGMFLMATFNWHSYHTGYRDGTRDTMNSVYGKNPETLAQRMAADDMRKQPLAPTAFGDDPKSGLHPYINRDA